MTSAVTLVLVAVAIASGCGSQSYVRSGGAPGGTGGNRPVPFDASTIPVLIGSDAATAGTGGATGSGTSDAGGPVQGDAGVSGGKGAGGAAGGVTCNPGVGGAMMTSSGTVEAGTGYDFEGSVESWKVEAGSAQSLTLSSSTAQHFSGRAALAASVVATIPSWFAILVDPTKSAIPAGATVTLHVYVPGGVAISWIQPYVQETANAWTWSGLYAEFACLVPDAWNTLLLNVPATGTAPVARMGLQFYVNAPWTGTIYLDAITW